MDTQDNKKISSRGTSGKELYQKNLEALSKHHPDLVELIESLVIEEDRIKVLRAESGQPRILYKKDDGEEVFIHNAEDPAQCANQAIDLLGQMEKEGIAVLFGFGLGYFAEEVFKRFEKGHIMMVYEATPELFKTALSTRDLSDLLESEKVKIVLGEEADNFSIIHSYHNLISNGKFWVVKHHPSAKLNEKAYEYFYKRLNEEKRLSDSGVATAVNLGKEFINTFLSNIPSILRRTGVNKLKDVFKGRPVIIVSAGPSLDKNLHLLKKAKGKAVIIAVDAVLPTLLPCDIIPDIIVAIDPLESNIPMFKDIPRLNEVPFICLAQYTPEIVSMYPGPLFFNSVPQNIAYQWLSGLWEDKGYIECFGGSVAHLAFGAAEFLGSDLIAFVGQDLSFSKEVHSRGFSDISYKQMQEHIKNGFKHFPSDKKWAIPIIKEGIQKGIDPLDYFVKKTQAVPTVNIFNEDVFTRGDFLSFKTSFENKIKTFKGTVINATEGGLPIEGATSMRLRDFIDEHCDLSGIDTSSILREITDGTVSYNLDGLMTEMTAARDKFREIKRNSNRVQKFIKRLKILKEKGRKDSQEFHNILDKVGSLIEQIKHPILNIMVGYHYGLELYLKRQDMQEIDEIEDKWEKLDKQLDRGAHYYREIVKAVDLFNKRLNRLITALQREKKVNMILTDDSLKQSEKYFSAGMIYRKAGLAAQAVRYFEKIVSSQKALIPLAEMYIKQFRFYEAKEILTGVRSQEAEVRSQESRITELLKVCDKKIREWEERKQKMNKMLKEAEANYGSHLESGYFYFRIKDFKRAEDAYLKAVKNQESVVRGQGAGVAAYYGLAHTYLAMEDPEKAVDALEKAIEIEPDNPILYRDLGFIAFRNNDTASAEIFLTRAIELEPKAEELYKPLASLYMSLGEREKAISLYEDALLVNPDNPVIQQDLAMLLKDVVTKTGRC
ncbi:MAG TPA: DUF115 domain-containing protein [Nitrospirae bacterium]|nr:DUF115 domain-containing protein [Nitrospirota bacterium]